MECPFESFIKNATIAFLNVREEDPAFHLTRLETRHIYTDALHHYREVQRRDEFRSIMLATGYGIFEFDHHGLQSPVRILGEGHCIAALSHREEPGFKELVDAFCKRHSIGSWILKPAGGLDTTTQILDGCRLGGYGDVMVSCPLEFVFPHWYERSVNRVLIEVEKDRRRRKRKIGREEAVRKAIGVAYASDPGSDRGMRLDTALELSRTILADAEKDEEEATCDGCSPQMSQQVIQFARKRKDSVKEQALSLGTLPKKIHVLAKRDDGQWLSVNRRYPGSPYAPNASREEKARLHWWVSHFLAELRDDGMQIHAVFHAEWVEQSMDDCILMTCEYGFEKGRKAIQEERVFVQTVASTVDDAGNYKRGCIEIVGHRGFIGGDDEVPF